MKPATVLTYLGICVPAYEYPKQIGKDGWNECEINKNVNKFKELMLLTMHWNNQEQDLIFRYGLETCYTDQF